MKRVLISCFFALIIGAYSGPVGAHHAAQAQFDLSKTVVLEGKCVKMEWINPHAYMHLSVMDQGGAAKTWQLETVGPVALRRAGLSRGDNSMKCDPLGGGGTYVVRGFPARNGTTTALIADLKLHDGRIVKLLDVKEFQLPSDFDVK
jgi:hypothetical protein